MMKKIIACLVALTLIMSLGACEKKEKEKNEKNSEKQSVTNISEEESMELAEEANTRVKVAYNAIAQYCCDMETQGHSIDESLSETLGEIDCSASEPTDKCQLLIYETMKEEYGENAGIVFIGISNENDYETFFVQWRESKDSKIFGQYPDPVYPDSEEYVWGEYNAGGEETSSLKQQELETEKREREDEYRKIEAEKPPIPEDKKVEVSNSNAKTAYNSVANYVADMELSGYSISDALSGTTGEFDCRESEPNDEARSLIYQSMSYNNSTAGIVYVGITTIYGQKAVFVQWRESYDSEIIGQYPDPPTSTDEQLEWGKFS